MQVQECFPGSVAVKIGFDDSEARRIIDSIGFRSSRFIQETSSFAFGGTTKGKSQISANTPGADSDCREILRSSIT